MPVSALVLSYLLLGEAFRWIHVAGFDVVFAGVLLMSWERAQGATKLEPPDPPQLFWSSYGNCLSRMAADATMRG
jgi:drug/metabolite transporter (DMT)-like permease